MSRRQKEKQKAADSWSLLSKKKIYKVKSSMESSFGGFWFKVWKIKSARIEKHTLNQSKMLPNSTSKKKKKAGMCTYPKALRFPYYFCHVSHSQSLWNIVKHSVTHFGSPDSELCFSKISARGISIPFSLILRRFMGKNLSLCGLCWSYPPSREKQAWWLGIRDIKIQQRCTSLII